MCTTLLQLIKQCCIYCTANITKHIVNTYKHIVGIDLYHCVQSKICEAEGVKKESFVCKKEKKKDSLSYKSDKDKDICIYFDTDTETEKEAD